jgi:hypothetical protein
VVFTQTESRAVIAEMKGARRLIAGLLYGSGLRIMEAVRLRIRRPQVRVLLGAPDIQSPIREDGLRVFLQRKLKRAGADAGPFLFSA